MKRNKQYLSMIALLCAVALLLGLGVTALAAVDYGAELNPEEKTYVQTFSDVPTDHWAFQYVGELVERGAINGYPDGKFYPNKIVTREEFAKIMVVAAGLVVDSSDDNSYIDVDTGYWASPFIEAAKPYMTAYQDTWGMSFHPKEGALREDIAVAVVKLKGYDTRLADLSIIQTMFSDVDGISAAAQPYVALAVENGIISGYVDGTFRGQATITRSEAAAMLWRAFQYGNDNKVVVAETSPAATPKPTATPKPAASPSPTASTKPTASPSPSPSPSPSAKPTLPPEPTEAAKPYIAETVVKNVKISDTDAMMTMDGDSNLIFYNENTDQIVSLNPGTDKTCVLLDVASATCEIPLGGQTAALSAEDTREDGADAEDGADVTDDEPQSSEETEDLNQNEPEPEPEPAPPATVTYEDLTVNQVFWDDVAGRLLVWGEFASVRSGGDDGWDVPDKDTGLNGIFVLENKELTYFAEMPVIRHDRYMRCALSDGTFVLGSYIYDFSTGDTVADLGEIGKPVFQYDLDIYVCYWGRYENQWNNYWLTKYNYGTDRLEKIGERDLFEPCRTYANQVIYSWNSNRIWAIRPTDAATQDKLDPSEDVEIKDLRPLPTSPDNLRVTSDEQYLFYDSSSNAIRVIRPNPAA